MVCSTAVPRLRTASSPATGRCMQCSTARTTSPTKINRGSHRATTGPSAVLAAPTASARGSGGAHAPTDHTWKRAAGSPAALLEAHHVAVVQRLRERRCRAPASDWEATSRSGASLVVVFRRASRVDEKLAAGASRGEIERLHRVQKDLRLVRLLRKRGRPREMQRIGDAPLLRPPGRLGVEEIEGGRLPRGPAVGRPRTCGIRVKAATDSDGKRPLIPTQGGHPIRAKAATDSDRRRPPCG
jgi:hypothetical protein